MSPTVALHGWMTDGATAWIGLAGQLVAAAAYLAAAGRRSPRGLRWPLHRTAAFLAGLLVIAIALESGVAEFDEAPTLHVIQHVLLMMLAPMLIAVGAPVTLIMRTLSPRGRRRLRALLHDPSVRRVISSPGVLILDYNITMAIVMLAPVAHLGQTHVAVHIAIHGYLILCGLLFWTAILARDPVPGRLSVSTRLLAAYASIPVNLTLAAALLIDPAAFLGTQPNETVTVALILATGMTATSALGMLFIALNARRRRARSAVRRNGLYPAVQRASRALSSTG
jgi:cytochrome c oxidase assembly factor CtaG